MYVFQSDEFTFKKSVILSIHFGIWNKGMLWIYIFAKETQVFKTQCM